MKKAVLIWIVIAGIISLYTTFLEVEPARTSIRLFTDDFDRYSLIAVLGLTFILVLLPLLLVMLIYYFIQHKIHNKHKMPNDFTGKTGIVIKRKKELTNVALMYGIFINSEQKTKLGIGKSAFVELEPGIYSIQVKLGIKIYSPQIFVQLEHEKILSYHTKADFSKSITMLVPKGEMLSLVQVPFSNNK